MNPTRRHTGGVVVFDLDGTLVDSEPYWATGFSLGLADILRRRGHGSHQLDPSDMGRFRGGRVPDTVAQIVDWLGLSGSVRGPELERVTDEVIASVTRSFAAHPTPIPVAVAAAQELAHRGVPMAVASSSAAEFIAVALEAIGLASAFPVQVSAVGLDRGKPDPLVYELALQALGAPAATAVAIEDSPVGVAAAVNAGMACVWFDPEAGPGTDRPSLDRLGPLVQDDRQDTLRDSVTVVSEVTADLVVSVLEEWQRRSAGA